METESRERKQINDGNAFTLFLKKEICTESVLFSVPLYTGVFHRHFYSDKPIPVSPAEAEQRHEFPEEELSVPIRPPVKRGRPRKAVRKHEFQRN